MNWASLALVTSYILVAVLELLLRLPGNHVSVAVCLDELEECSSSLLLQLFDSVGWILLDLLILRVLLLLLLGSCSFGIISPTTASVASASSTLEGLDLFFSTAVLIDVIRADKLVVIEFLVFLFCLYHCSSVCFCC